MRKKLEKKFEEIVNRKKAASNQLEEAQRKAAAEKNNVETLFQKYMSLGGDAIGDLEKTIVVFEQYVIKLRCVKRSRSCCANSSCIVSCNVWNPDCNCVWIPFNLLSI